MSIVDPDSAVPILAEEWELLRDRWPDAARLATAFRLAPTLEVCAALLRRESVPRDRLDPEWVQRLGLRRWAA